MFSNAKQIHLCSFPSSFLTNGHLSFVSSLRGPLLSGLQVASGLCTCCFLCNALTGGFSKDMDFSHFLLPSVHPLQEGFTIIHFPHHAIFFCNNYPSLILLIFLLSPYEDVRPLSTGVFYSRNFKLPDTCP